MRKKKADTPPKILTVAEAAKQLELQANCLREAYGVRLELDQRGLRVYVNAAHLSDQVW